MKNTKREESDLRKSLFQGVLSETFMEVRHVRDNMKEKITISRVMITYDRGRRTHRKHLLPPLPPL